MNIPARHLLLSALLALALVARSGLWAEEAPPAVTETPSAPAAPQEKEAPAPQLRRLDEPAAESTESKAAEPNQPQEAATPAEGAKDKNSDREHSSDERYGDERRHHRNHGRGSARVIFWGDASLDADESAEGVVSIVGSSTSAGEVGDAVVSILGSSTSSGKVGSGVISILGSSRVTGGSVNNVVVSIFGTSFVNAPIHGDVVAVLGDVELGPDAVVDGDVTCVGGFLKRDAKAVIHGGINQVGFGMNFSGMHGLHAWVAECLRYARPLAFHRDVLWAWWLVIGFLGLYVLLAGLFPKSVENCVATFEQRPGYSLLTALLVTIIAPLATILLMVTIVGGVALAFFLLLAGIFGKMVMIAWIGRRLTNAFGRPTPVHPALAVVVGGIVVLLLYTVPVVGFLMAKLLSWVGLGVVIATILLTSKRNRTVRPVMASAAAVPPATAAPAAVIPSVIPPPTAPIPPVAPMGVPPPSAPMESAGFTGAPPSPVATPPIAAVPPVVVSASTLTRAGFWIRLAASALDGLLVALAVGLIPDKAQPNYLLLYAAYCIVLWGLRGTTIGGIVCNLKVVRLDDRPVDWPTALVRGLGGFLSFFAAGIGFIWVSFDDQRQSWHDKIAGTTVVHVPKGVSLI
jgi:uncharacterized RDD family membrane protein YckC